MLIRGWKRLFPLLVPLLIITFIVLKLHNEQWITLPYRTGKIGLPGTPTVPTFLQPTPEAEPEDESYKSGHRELFSLSTPDRNYFSIEFAPQGAINPNIIPHPVLNDTWIIVGMQQRSTVKKTVWTAELVCSAVFKNGRLECKEPPQILPIGVTKGNAAECNGNLAFLNLNNGPHDARVFYGPANPYTIYGSNSMHNCFGQWMSDFRTLFDWPYEVPTKKEIRRPTDLQRPKPYAKVEKNYFVFWDREERLYAHFDISPNRVFAKLAIDGSVGEDLAPLAKANDEVCMSAFMPKLKDVSEGSKESIHQATNSLSITTCKRSDPACVPNADNTFIMTIFQHKHYFKWHSTYEPYVMLFRQEAPFEIHGISTKPFWIHGRGGPGTGMKPDAWRPWNGPLQGEPGYDVNDIEKKWAEARPWRQKKGRTSPGEMLDNEPWPETELFYVTSLAWKQQGQKYHGYIDDVLFMGIGIEDFDTAGMDIHAGDLLQDIGICATLPKPVVELKKEEKPSDPAQDIEKSKDSHDKETEKKMPDHDAHQGFKDPETKNGHGNENEHGNTLNNEKHDAPLDFGDKPDPSEPVAVPEHQLSP